MNGQDEKQEKKPDELMKVYLSVRRQALLTETDQIERLLGYPDERRTAEIRKMAKR